MKNYRQEIKWGLLFVAMQLLWMTGEKLSGLHDVHIEQHALYTNLIAIPAMLLYLAAFLAIRKNAGGCLRFAHAMRSGMVITLVVTLLSPLTQYLTVAVISPDYFANASAFAVENSLMTDAEAADFFNLNHYLMLTLVSTPIMGLLTSLIIGGILALIDRKKLV